MASKHTPGDWYQYQGDYIATDQHYVARVMDHVSDKELQANIRLIAKAPEMYERIVMLLAYRQRNTANFQLEKADDHFRALRRIIDEIEAGE
jgi:hypothetical protein